MKGLEHVTSNYVFLTDADTRAVQGRGSRLLIAELERGADAVGGVPSSDLRGGGVLGTSVPASNSR